MNEKTGRIFNHHLISGQIIRGDGLGEMNVLLLQQGKGFADIIGRPQGCGRIKAAQHVKRQPLFLQIIQDIGADLAGARRVRSQIRRTSVDVKAVRSDNLGNFRVFCRNKDGMKQPGLQSGFTCPNQHRLAAKVQNVFPRQTLGVASSGNDGDTFHDCFCWTIALDKERYEFLSDCAESEPVRYTKILRSERHARPRDIPLRRADPAPCEQHYMPNLLQMSATERLRGKECCSQTGLSKTHVSPHFFHIFPLKELT